MVVRWVLPLVVAPLSCLPALRLFPGQTPAHEAKWAALGNRAMSAPISAMIAVNRRRGDRSGRRQGEQQLDGSLVLVEEGGDAPLHPLDRLFQRGDVVKQFADEQPLLGVHAPGQRLTQGRQLLAQPPLGQLGQDLRIGLPLLDRPQHPPPTDPHHIAGDCPPPHCWRLPPVCGWLFPALCGCD
jgi:hypothetical protein